MIENPKNWVADFGDYIVEPQNFDYGSLAIIDTNAPKKAKESFQKYIDLAVHIFTTREDVVLVPNENGGLVITKVEEYSTDDSDVQFAMFQKLVEQEYVKNDPYTKI